MKTTNERGYTMIETIIYIGLLIVLGGWLASLAHTTYLRYKIGRTTQQILDLRKAILHFTATAEDYSELTIEAMNAGSSLPRDMRTSNNTTAKHALGGAVQIGPATEYKHITSAANKETHRYMFYIIFENLSKKACAEILTQGQFYGDGSGLDTIIVNGNTKLTANTKKGKAWRYQNSLFYTSRVSSKKTWTDNRQILSVSEALDACTDKNNNSITWIFS